MKNKKKSLFVDKSMFKDFLDTLMSRIKKKILYLGITVSP